MHEISIMQALFQQVEGLAGQYGSRRIRRIVVEVGEISNLVPELFQQAFEAFRQVKPLLEQAQLEIRKIELQMVCRECGQQFQPLHRHFRCLGCGSLKVESTQGEELLLRDVELEVQEGVHCG